MAWARTPTLLGHHPSHWATLILLCFLSPILPSRLPRGQFQEKGWKVFGLIVRALCNKARNAGSNCIWMRGILGSRSLTLWANAIALSLVGEKVGGHFLHYSHQAPARYGFSAATVLGLTWCYMCACILFCRVQSSRDVQQGEQSHVESKIQVNAKMAITQLRNCYLGKQRWSGI